MLSRRVPREVEPNPWWALLEELRAKGTDLVDLTEANPTRVGLGGPTKDALAALADPRALRYEPDPRGLVAAREAIADYYAERGATVDPDGIVLTSGTSEAYAHLFRLLCDAGDAVLVPRPSYPLFEPLAAAESVALESYRLTHDQRWRLDLDSVARAIRQKTKAVLLVQPNHPTGSCLEGAEFEALEALCERHGLALIVDEVFADFSWTESPLPRALGERRVPTFVLNGLSKVCGMPQLKLSWVAVAGPSPARDEALRGLEWLADLFLSVSTPVQLALPSLLEAGRAFREAVRERVIQNRAALGEWAARRSGVELPAADGGWISLLRMPDTRDEETWALDLLRAGVVVHPGHFYDFEDDPWAVVSLIVEVDRLREGLRRMGAVFTASAEAPRGAE